MENALENSQTSPRKSCFRNKLRSLYRFHVPACVVIILVVYTLYLSYYFAPALTHPDANGYWAQGSLLMDTGHTWFKPESSAQYIGMHWLITPEDEYISRYPPGLPLVAGIVWKLFGWKASLLVNPILAIFSLLGVFFIVRRLVSADWGLFAMVALGVNPTFSVQALTNISHMSVAFCLIWGFYLLLLWSEKGKLTYAFFGGLVLGCIPTLRYADSIVALGIIAFLLWHWRSFPRIYLHYAMAVLGAIIPVIPLLIRNQALLGAFWRTGYSLTNEQTGFGWAYFKVNYLQYLQSLQGNGLGMLFVFGLAAIIWMLYEEKWRATGLFLLLSSTPLLLVYMAYYWGGRGGMPGPGPRGGGGGAGHLRFLVPMVPVYIIAASWGLSRALNSAKTGVRITVPILIILVQSLIFVPELSSQLEREKQQKIPLSLATDGLAETAKPGDLVLANNGLLAHLDFVREWKLADPSVISDRRGERMGRFRERDPDSPSPMQQQKRENRSRLYDGCYEDKQTKFLDDIEKWAGKRSIYIVGTEEELTRLLPGIAKTSIKIIKRIPTPKREDNDPSFQRRNPMNGFRPPGNFNNDRRRRGMFGGGMFGRGFTPGEDIVIARWE